MSCTFFALHMSHIHSNNMWNQIEINYNMLNLFAIQNIHLLEGINHVLCQAIIKHYLNVSMNTVAIPNIGVKFWTCKSEFPQGNFLRSLTQL